MFGLTKPLISGLINFGIAFQTAGQVTDLKEAVCKYLRSPGKLHIYRREPPAHHVSRTRQLLDILIDPQSETGKKQRLVLAKYFNGDISRTDYVEHYCPDGCCVSVDSCLDTFCTLVVDFLFLGTPGIFPRHRWTGLEQPLSWVALAMSFHGLLSQAFAPGSAGQAALADAAGYDHAEVENPVVAPGPAVAVDIYMQAKQARVDARTFAHESPVSSLLVLALVLQPMVVLIRSILHLAGAEFDFEQLVKGSRQEICSTVPLCRSRNRFIRN
jgi:hypothetical protein